MFSVRLEIFNINHYDEQSNGDAPDKGEELIDDMMDDASRNGSLLVEQTLQHIQTNQE